MWAAALRPNFLPSGDQPKPKNAVGSKLRDLVCPGFSVQWLQPNIVHVVFTGDGINQSLSIRG